MNIPATVHLPDYIYSFYANASRCILGSTPETVMSDALTAYAGLLCQQIARQAGFNQNSEEEP